MDFLLLRSPAFFPLLRFFFYFNTIKRKILEHLPDHFPANSRPFPYPNPTYFCAFPLFLFLFWLNSLPEKACAVKGKNSRLNHTEPSKFLLGSLFLFSRNNFFCGGLSLPFLPYPPSLDGSVFFWCFFGVRRKEFFLFRRLMLGFGLVLGRNRSRQCSNIPFLFLLL